jgi:hypothetical protein
MQSEIRRTCAAYSVYLQTKRKMYEYMLEKDVEKAVIRRFRALGWYVRKFTSPARRSVPDDIFLKRGFVFWIEFKAKGKKPTPNQEQEIKLIREKGGIVFVVDSIDAGAEVLAFAEMLV